MSDREWASTNVGRAAIAVLAISTVLAIWTLVNAIRIAPVPEVAAPAFASSAALAAPGLGAAADVEAAVQGGLFEATRTAPARNYRAPGEEGDDVAPQQAPVLPVVLGTAVSDPGHSFATVQLAESRATIMHVGDKIGDYMVYSIERGRVVFTNAAKKKLEIPELKP